MSFEVAAGDPTPFDRVCNLEDREMIAAALLELDVLHREVWCYGSMKSCRLKRSPTS